MNKNSILITGVAGLLGSRMADWIVENHPEYEVVGIDNLFGGYIENVNEKVIFYKRELGEDDISDIFEKHNFKYVYHFAAYAAEGLSYFMPIFNDKNNMLSTDSILKECVIHGVERLIYTSSMAVYGHGSGNPFDENDIPNPIDPYGVSKYGCEKNIQIFGEHFGLDWCIIRPHNVMRVKQNIWDKYRNVLGIWMYQILNNLPISVYGDGEQTRAFSYIDDCLESFWNAAVFESASKQIINVGGINGYTINEAAEILCDITGYDKSNITHLEPRHEVKWCVPSYQKSIDLLGYTEKTSLKEGLTKMWEWAKTQPNRERYKWENYEITKGIYSYWK
jgi:UDP-glucose 4-epimerase